MNILLTVTNRAEYLDIQLLLKLKPLFKTNETANYNKHDTHYLILICTVNKLREKGNFE